MAGFRVQALTCATLVLAGWGVLSAGNRPADAQGWFHSARITRVAVDPTGRILATASEDKTVRTWDLPSGRPLRIIRSPAGPGPHGEVYALAISPDGKTLAFGGFIGQKNRRLVDGRAHFDYEVLVHDLRSGQRSRTLDVPALIDHLSYAPSGDSLMAAASYMPVSRFGEINDPLRALIIFATRSYRPLEDVPDFYAAVADRDRHGRLIVIGRPGGHFIAELRGPDLALLESRNFRGNPGAVSFSPDGSTAAVSTLFGEVHVFSTRDLSRLYSPDLRGAAGGDGVPPPPSSPEGATIAWSMDGRVLYYASAATCRPSACAVRKWAAGGRGPYQDLVVAPDRVTHVVPLPGGGIAFGTAGPAFGVVDANDVRTLYRDRSAVSLARVPLGRQPAGTPRPADEARSGAPRVRLAPPDEQRLAELHEAITVALEKLRPAEALPLAREALQLTELRAAPGDSVFVVPLMDLGRAYHAAGRYRKIVGSPGKGVPEYREAQTHLERAVRLLERDKGVRHPDVADVLEELAAVREAMSRFDEAADVAQRILDIRRSGGDLRRVAQAENDIEVLRVQKLIRPEFGANLAKALPLALAQLRDAETRLGGSHVNVARGGSNLATIYQKSRVGLHGTALRLRNQAVEIYSVARGAGHWEVVAEVAAIAGMHRDAREFAEAERMYALVEEAAASALGSDHPAVMDFLSRQGGLLQDSGQHDKAATVFARALAYWDDRVARGGDGRAISDVRRSLESLADTHVLLGDHVEADRLYSRLLGLKDPAGMRPFMVARVLGKRAEQQRRQGQLGPARAGLAEALALIEKDISAPDSGGSSVADSIARHVFGELAAVAVASGDRLAAAQHLARAVSIDNHLMRLVFRPRPAGELLDEAQDSSATRFYHGLLSMTARQFPDDAHVVASAFGVVLNRKHITLDLQGATRGPRHRLPERAREGLAELARVRSELARVMVARLAGIPDAEYEQTVALAFERVRDLENRLVGMDAYAAWIEGRSAPRVTPADVAASLPHDTALVELVRVEAVDPGAPAEDRYLAFALTGSGRLSLVDLGAARTIEELVSDLQSALRGGAQPALVVQLLRTLYSRLWVPIAGLVGEPGRVILSADGELHRVPFAALMDPQGRFLIERHQLAHVGSGRDLVSAQGPPAPAGQDLVLLADPDFGPGDRFAPLPGTAREAKLIPPLVPGNKGRTILVGRDATKSALKAVASPRILHIATHGVFLARDTLGLERQGYEHSLVKSALALAGANDPTGAEGMLTALEVSDMELSGTQLVVLSACDTGAGSVTRGQGVLGLRRALSLAGARSVLMTLWPVDDAVTAEVMTRFYTGVTSVSPAEALHRAQTELLGQLRRRHGFADPGLWAPFLLESPAAFAPLPPG